HKSSSTGTVPFIVPDYKELALEYEPAFNVNNQRYAEIVAIMQKFIGESISYNEYYDYNEYANGVIPIKEVIKNWIYACKLGIKTFYYLNTDVNNGGAANQGCSSGGCTL
ncbi:MAG: ribonucleoside-diphosphate reductase subunit alpha, partial [Epsilonproteobacteria bacterium]